MRLFNCVVLFGVFLAGCAGHNISEKQWSAITALQVDPVKITAEKPTFHGLESGLAAAFGGAVGGALVAAVAPEPEKIRSYLSENRIDPAEIVQWEFLGQIATRSSLRDRIVPSADHHLIIEIYAYGLYRSGMLSSGYKPYLGIKARIEDKDRIVVWQKVDFVANRNEVTPSLPYDDYFKSADTFINAFASAARVLTESILNDLPAG